MVDCLQSTHLRVGDCRPPCLWQCAVWRGTIASLVGGGFGTSVKALGVKALFTSIRDGFVKLVQGATPVAIKKLYIGSPPDTPHRLQWESRMLRTMSEADVEGSSNVMGIIGFQAASSTCGPQMWLPLMAVEAS